MYLSRLILNPQSRQVQRELAEPYEMHRTLMRSFVYGDHPDSGRVLFRVDVHPRTGSPTLLVQSHQEPSWDWVGDVKGPYLMQTTAANPHTKPYELKPVKGQVLSFRLRANPTVKRNKKRFGLLNEDGQRKWITRKGAEGGFRLLQVRMTNEGCAQGWIHRQDENSHKLNLLSIRFDGFLVVEEPELFLETVENGIGPGKGLGFGLLSLAHGS